MRRRFLILHGWQGSGPDHWQTWLVERLRARGEIVRYPELPECDHPAPRQWQAALRYELEVGLGEGERIVVCHSLACVLWCAHVAATGGTRQADRVALVAPAWRADIPELAAFFPVALDAQAVARASGSTRVVCSDDDPYCPGGAAQVFATPLGVPADVLAGAGHINPDAGFGPWPAMEAWCVDEGASLVPG